MASAGFPRLLVAGSVALDRLEGDFGVVEDELGGSALYFALAASLLMSVAVTAPVGEDAEEEFHAAIAARPIDASLVSVLPQPTYRWHAKHAHGGNVDLGSQDSIYDHWEPQVRADFDGTAFLGSMRPARQADVARQLSSADLVAADAMQSYASAALLEVEEVVQRCDWFFCNAAELDLLAPGIEPEAFRRQNALQGLCLKAGPAGSTIYSDQSVTHVDALRSQVVADTTGAGDALAGGFLARWLQLGRHHDALHEALVYGTACASLTIEDIGVRALQRATPLSLQQRVAELNP